MILPLVLFSSLLAQTQPQVAERWVYCSCNLWVDRNVDQLEEVMRRAAKAGYTHVLLADSKFSRLADMDARYFRNLERVKAVAKEVRLEIVPAVFPIGYSEGLLSRDPNLAEGLPAREALFVVKGGEARLQADPPVSLPEDFAKWSWKDDTVALEGGAAKVVDPAGRNARVVQKLKLSPFRQYHVSVRVKTEGFQGEPEIKVLAGKQSLQYASLGVKATQDWTEHHAVFNSLEAQEVNLYLGCWGAEKGTLWWKDARIEEVGLLNVVRRDGAPLVVHREGGAALVEGKDFDAVSDPRMGTVPWPGGYEVWHEPPVLRVRAPDGTRLRVSWYHAITVGDGQVMICPSEPKTVELLRDEAKRMHAAWGAKGYFMSHDEIRVLNWDDSCARRKLSAGAILADNARTCVKVLREVNPQGRVYVWSDMFDPCHNAHADYYLVHGDLAGSWEGLDPEVRIAAWYYEKRDESLAWFAKRGHKMILAGYYDGPVDRVRGWLDAASKVKGVEGVMYTTWRGAYGDLEEFARRLR